MNHSRTKTRMVCPVSLSGTLDNWIRRWIQNPRKLLNPYVHDGMTVLDVGCGPGFFSIPMAEMVGSTGRVIAVDIQRDMLEIVKSNISGTGLENRITLHQCAQGEIGLNEQVEFVLLFYMLHEVSTQEKFLRELIKYLKPDGQILVVEPPFHVSKKAFKQSIELAVSVDLMVVDMPNIFPNKTALLKLSREK